MQLQLGNEFASKPIRQRNRSPFSHSSSPAKIEDALNKIRSRSPPLDGTRSGIETKAMIKGPLLKNFSKTSYPQIGATDPKMWK